MKKHILNSFGMLLVTFISLPAMSAFYGDYETYNRATLQGLKTIAVNIDPPRGSDYTEMYRYGVTKEGLQEMISRRLRDAGFTVISLAESLEDPDAVLLDLRVRVDIPWGSFYTFDLNLSLKQKVGLPRGKNSFYSVRTWSDGQLGALQQSGYGLYPLYGYTLQLVDNFIRAYRTQN
jgi:hypothetical protein